jgi:hypothetical protein
VKTIRSRLVLLLATRGVDRERQHATAHFRRVNREMQRNAMCNDTIYSSFTLNAINMA